MCAVLLPQVVNTTTVNKCIDTSTYNSKFKTNYPRICIPKLSFNGCLNTAPVRRNMKGISNRKPKSKPGNKRRIIPL